MVAREVSQEAAMAAEREVGVILFTDEERSYLLVRGKLSVSQRDQSSTDVDPSFTGAEARGGVRARRAKTMWRN